MNIPEFIRRIESELLRSEHKDPFIETHPFYFPQFPEKPTDEEVQAVVKHFQEKHYKAVDILTSDITGRKALFLSS